MLVECALLRPQVTEGPRNAISIGRITHCIVSDPLQMIDTDDDSAVRLSGLADFLQCMYSVQHAVFHIQHSTSALTKCMQCLCFVATTVGSRD